MPMDPDRPAWMAGRLSEAITRLTTRIGDAGFTALTQAAKAKSQWRVFQELLACSDFFGEQVARQYEWLCGALADGTLLEGRDWMAQEWDRALYALLPSTQSEPEALAALRIFRHREMVRILWRDHAQLASLEEAFEALSQLADCCIRAALTMATVTLKEKYGTPYGTDSGQPQSLVVLGMGKLGGNELNFSSDIDLIFAYPEGGHTRGGRQELDNQAYFIRLGQMVIRLLDAVTEDGFAFRVDMRLRPYGDSGALVGSYNALEVYYQEQGREWERYAMIKARPISGTPEAQESLMDMLGPFVYRRYTDFSVIAALREMKNLMRAEVMRLGMDNDLKRGAGGIREIEFIAQSLQLIHGGRIPELRSRSLLSTLSALEQAEVLSTDQARRLATHYRLERRVEHALQAMQDRQTQSLPSEPVPQQQLALLSGLGDWETLQAHLAEAQREVAALFNDLIAEPLATSGDDATRDQDAASGVSFSSLSQMSLVELGYQHAEESWVVLRGRPSQQRAARVQREAPRERDESRRTGALRALGQVRAGGQHADQHPEVGCPGRENPAAHGQHGAGGGGQGPPRGARRAAECAEEDQALHRADPAGAQTGGGDAHDLPAGAVQDEAQGGAGLHGNYHQHGGQRVVRPGGDAPGERADPGAGAPLQA